MTGESTRFWNVPTSDARVICASPETPPGDHWSEFSALAQRIALSVCRGGLLPPGLAEDMAQEACVRAVEKGARFASLRAAASWLHSTIRYIALELSRDRRLRRAAIEAVSQDIESASVPSTPSQSPLPLLHELVRRLPPMDQELVHRRLAGWSTKALARDAEITPRAIRYRIRRVERRLCQLTQCSVVSLSALLINCAGGKSPSSVAASAKEKDYA